MLFNYKKIPYLNLVPILLIAFILFRLVNHAEGILSVFTSFLSILSYIFWAMAIAYILNPMMVFLEKKLKLRRMFSVLVIYFAFTLCIVVAVTIVTPRLVSSLESLGKMLSNTSDYIKQTEAWINSMMADWQDYDKYNITAYIRQNLDGIFNQASQVLDFSLNLLFEKVLNLTSTLIKLIMAIIISIYFLIDKEKFMDTSKKLLYAFVKDETADYLIDLGGRLNEMFYKYITGRLIDATIMSIFCFIGLLIMGVPYALLISITVGLMDLIPYFGGLLGMIPTVIILLFAAPFKIIWVLLFLLALSQFDGLYLSPKIIGDKVGLHPILIIVALAIGGSLYGIVGMLIAVPLMAVIKTLVLEYADRKLEQKKQHRDPKLQKE